MQWNGILCISTKQNLSRPFPEEIEFGDNPSKNESLNMKLRETLATQRPDIDFQCIPMEQALQIIGDMFGVLIWIDWGELRSTGDTVTGPVTMRIDNKPMSVAIRLALKALAGSNTEVAYCLDGGKFMDDHSAIWVSTPTLLRAAQNPDEFLQGVLHRELRVSDQPGQERPQVFADSGRVFAEQLFFLKERLQESVLIDSQNTMGRTELHVASEAGHFLAVRYLLLKDAKANIGDFQGVTPAHLASAHGKSRILRALLRNGASITATDRNGRTLLHYAARNGQIETASVLLTEWQLINNIGQPLLIKADVNRPDKNGQTPLFLAALNGKVEMVQYLLAQGADLDTKDRDGKAIWQLVQHKIAMGRRSQRTAVPLDKVRSLLADLFAQRGLDRADKNQYERAITDISVAISLGLRETRLYMARAIAFSQTGDSNKAISDFETAISHDPSILLHEDDRHKALRAYPEFVTAAKRQQALINWPLRYSSHPAKAVYDRIYFNANPLDQAVADRIIAAAKQGASPAEMLANPYTKDAVNQSVLLQAAISYARVIHDTRPKQR